MNFPPTKFYKEIDVYEQFEKIRQEMEEAYEAFLDGKIQHCSVELHDLAQATVTLLWVLKCRFGADLYGAKLEMLAKNLERGYYSDEDTMTVISMLAMGGDNGQDATGKG